MLEEIANYDAGLGVRRAAPGDDARRRRSRRVRVFAAYDLQRAFDRRIELSCCRFDTRPRGCAKGHGGGKGSGVSRDRATSRDYPPDLTERSLRSPGSLALDIRRQQPAVNSWQAVSNPPSILSR